MQWPQETQLTAFFKANEQYAEACSIVYPDFPSKFTWDQRWWLPHKGVKTSERMVFVPLNAGEKFYAHLLLSVVTDVWNFTQLKSIDGVLHPTYCEACFAWGLLANDNKWKHTLEDGHYMHTGPQLHQLFVAIVANNWLLQPAQLWELFKVHLCDDLQHFLSHHNHVPLTDDSVLDYSHHLIQIHLQQDDKTMDAVGLPKPVHNWNVLLAIHHMSHHSTFDPAKQSQLCERNMPLLNHEQQHTFTCILDATIDHLPLTFFLQGAAGAGKTFVYNTLCYAARSWNLQVVCVALLGIAALLLPGGWTADSTLKIPIEIDKSSTCAISKQSMIATIVWEMHLLIWDKCSMQNCLAFEAIDCTLQDICENNVLFGGVTTVLSGDFLQTLPVVLLFSSPSDSLNTQCCIAFLSSLGINTTSLSQIGKEYACWRWPRWTIFRSLAKAAGKRRVKWQWQHCSHSRITSLSKWWLVLSGWIYLPWYFPPHGTEYYCEHCILAPCNCEAHEINNILLDQYPGQVYNLWSVDEAVDPDNPSNPDASYLPEVLHSAYPSGFPQAHLHLKIGCPVIVLCNLHSNEGICNGSQGIVTCVTTRVIEIVLLWGNTCLIPCIKLISADQQLPFHLHHRQFPLALSFAIMINKAQGQSFSPVRIDLCIPVFAQGQVQYMSLFQEEGCVKLWSAFWMKKQPHVSKISYYNRLFCNLN